MSTDKNYTQLLENIAETVGYDEWAETVLGILYFAVGIAAVAGNVCALYYFIRIDKHLTACKIFYLAFAVTDLIAGFSSCWDGLVFGKGRPFYFHSILANSKTVCNLVGVFSDFHLYAGLNVLALMTVSRCAGVITPFSFKRLFSKTRCYVMLGIVLIHPVVVSLVPVMAPTYETLRIGGVVEDKKSDYNYKFQMISGQTEYRTSELFWRNDTLSRQAALSNGHTLNIAASLVPRLFALVVTVVASVVVAVKLLRTTKMASTRTRKNNVSLTLLILAAVYFVTYAPFCVLTVIDVAQPQFSKTVDYRKVIFYLSPVCYLTAFVSSAVNPFVYHLRGKSIFESADKKSTAMSLYKTRSTACMMRETSNM